MRITKGGAITIPRDLRERYGLDGGTELELVPLEKGLLLRKEGCVSDPVAKWRDVLSTPADVDAYIEEVRGPR